MRLALDTALKVREAFCKYKFISQKNEDSSVINATEEQFIQNGGGMCRDFVRQQAKLLKKMGRKVETEFESLLYLPTRPDGSWLPEFHMHAFTVIYGVDGSVYVPESTLDAMTGTWYFATLVDCVSAIRIALGQSRSVNFKIYSYIGDDDALLGKERGETVEYIEKHGTLMMPTPDNVPVLYEGLQIGG